MVPQCPTCRNVGRKVRRVTLENLLRPECRADIAAGQYYVCTTPHCNTVYFSPDDEHTFRKSDLTVRFGLKETAGPRPICYCFDHTVEAIEDEVRRTGRSTVVERIKTDMKGPGCRCEYTNPLGACCLESVQAAVADAWRTIENEHGASPVASVERADCYGGDGGLVAAPAPADYCSTDGWSKKPVVATSSDCCPPPAGPPAGGSVAYPTGALAVGGSVVAAILSSACCWLPLVLIAFGTSAVGAAGFFEAYRPYFVAGAVVLLALGFYTAYFRSERCATDVRCAPPGSRLRVLNKAMLWMATVLVGAFVFFPQYVGYVLGSWAPTSPVAVGHLRTAEFHIDGMTCAGCAESPVAAERVIQVVEPTGAGAILADDAADAPRGSRRGVVPIADVRVTSLADSLDPLGDHFNANRHLHRFVALLSPT